MTGAPLTDSLRETLALFDAGGTPRTTSEVADALDLGRRSTYDRLERLVDHGSLATKKVGASARVWWRPRAREPGEGTAVAPDWPAAAESIVGDVLDGTEVGVFVLDDEFRVAWINEATERYFGLDREAVVARDKRRLVDERIAATVADSASFAERVLGAYDDNSGAEQFECRVTPGEGREERWLEHRSQPIESGAYAGGRVELYYDVSDRKRSERAHRRDREQLESLVEAVEEYAIYTLDPRGRVRTWNAGAALVEGYEAEQVLGEHVATFYTDADRAAGVPEADLAAATEREATETEGWRVRADGSRFWAHVTVSAMRDDDGDLRGYAVVTRDTTERREREQAMRLERDRLESVMEASPIGIGIFDSEGEPLRVNERFTELLGLADRERREYVLGEQPLLDEDGEVLPEGERPAERVLATGEPVVDKRVRVDGADGRTRWLSVNAEPFDGTTDGVVLTGTDVTRLEEQARRLERQRDDLESELDEVFERVDDAFFALDDEWRFTYVNERAADVMGRSRDALVGRSIWEVFPEAVDFTFGAEAEQAKRTGESLAFEEHIPQLDAWLEVNVYPSETGLSVYFRDVTARKERELELERYAGVVDAVGEPIYELDRDGRLTFVNEAFEEQSGYRESELLGEHISVVMDEAAIDRVESELAALAAEVGAGTTTVEFEVTAKDGERSPVENRITLLTDDEGRIRGSAGLVHDISERVERERKLEALTERMDSVVSNVPMILFALDPGGRFTLSEGQGLATLDLEPGELVGESVFDVFGAHEGIVADVELALAGERVDAVREVDGVVFDSTYQPVRDEDGDVTEVIGVSTDVTERREHERELERQREHLAALNNLNRVVREITEAVVDQSTREEIEATVCEHLADADSYEFAWIGDVDRESGAVNLRTEAGVEGYLDDKMVTTDPDDERSDGPAGRAILNREPQTARDVAADDRFDPWRDELAEYGFRSSAAIPIEHGETLYGVLNVYSERPSAFEGRELDVVAQLGEVVGHAIAAVERKRALMSDDVVELQFRMRDFLDTLDVDAPATGTISLEHAVTVEEGEYLVYGSAAQDAVETVETLADIRPHWADVSFRDGGDVVDFEIRFSEPPVLSRVASLGGSVEEAVIEDGDFDLTVLVSPGTDVRTIIDAVRDAYPSPELLKRRQVTRPEEPTAHLQRVLAEELTDRQRAALEAAYHGGFFEWPRETTGEDVAGALGISAPTFHQHLRMAERKVVDSLLSTSASPT